MAKRAEAIVERRAPLSRERVLRSALELADREGIEGFSMRRLATELGIEAMSLYHYFKSKDELLAGINDLVMEEVELPDSRPAEWKASLRRTAVSYHEALRRHPWNHSVRPNPQLPAPATLRYMESVLRRLREAGFSPRMTHHAYHILEGHVVGSSMWLAGVAAVIPKGKMEELAKKVMERVPIAEYPAFHEHIQQHIGKLTKGDKQPFELGLDLILDGLERMRDEVPHRKKKGRSH